MSNRRRRFGGTNEETEINWMWDWPDSLSSHRRRRLLPDEVTDPFRVNRTLRRSKARNRNIRNLVKTFPTHRTQGEQLFSNANFCGINLCRRTITVCFAVGCSYDWQNYNNFILSPDTQSHKYSVDIGQLPKRVTIPLLNILFYILQGRSRECH